MFLRLALLEGTMRSIDQQFYHSPEWKKCRASYMQYVNGRCERCLAKGRHVPARIVHHRIHLDLTNKDDASVAFNFENLEALCLDCHNKEHFKSQDKRWRVDERGEISPLSPE